MSVGQTVRNLLPWARPRPATEADGPGGRSFLPAAEPAITQLGFVAAACGLYASMLAAAAPGAPLTARLLQDCGWRLGMRGQWTAVIEVGPGGNLVLTPFDAWPSEGFWNGASRERDGRTSRSLIVPAAAVFHVELPAPPLGMLSSTASIAYELDRGMAREAAIPTGRLIETNVELASVSKPVRDDMASTFLGAVEKASVAVMPPGFKANQNDSGRVGPDPSDAAIKLRDQMRADVEGHFGIVGLLSRMDAGAVQELWRVATVRTFGPIADLIEAEAADKLGEPVTLRRDRWVAAPHSEIARAQSQRAAGVARLVSAGVDVADARAAMGL